jgi:hypothetical protein
MIAALVRGYAVEVAHAVRGLTLLKVRELAHVVTLPLDRALNVLADARYFFFLSEDKVFICSTALPLAAVLPM